MLNIQPETENATTLSDQNIKEEAWFSKSQESLHEDTASTSKQFGDTSQCTSYSPSQSSSKNSFRYSGKTANLADSVPETVVLPGKVHDSFKHASEISSQPVCKDAFILSMEPDEEISRLCENSSTRNLQSKEISNTTKNILQTPSQPICREESRMLSVSDEEISRLSENASTRIMPSKEIANTTNSILEAPFHCRNGSCSSLSSKDETSNMSVSLSIIPCEEDSHISKSTLQMSSAPTCKDGSSLSLYSDDETETVSETALATIEYASDVGSSSSESDVEEENVLSHLPQNLVAQTPQVLVDNSSDVHIGPHFQYTGPITVKQYITVNGREAIEGDNSLPSSSLPKQMPHLKDLVNITLPQGKEGNENNSTLPEVLKDELYTKDMKNFVINSNSSSNLSDKSCLNNGIMKNGIHISQDVLLNGSENTLHRTKNYLFKKRYILICLVVVIILSICISLSLVLPGRIYSEAMDVNINMTCKFKNLRVSHGDKTIQWAVDIVSRIGRLKVDWYGPGCKLIEQTDGPSKYEVQNVYQENGKMQTVLKVLNVTHKDRGLYKLHVYNDKDEMWDYFTLTVLGGGNIVACYVAEWAHKRIGLGMFTVDDIDPTQCTHLLFAFANLNTTSNTIYPADPSYDLGNEQERGAYEKMTSLKEKHRHLKVLISMGGWAERVEKNYSIVAESPARRKEFIASVVEFINKHNFDGLDLHWQYPTEKNGVPADKQNFVYLVKELREEFDKQGKQWLLTAPLGVMPNTIQGSYNIPEITKYLHYMFALCYAYHGFWDGQTGPNAPLYRSKAGDELNIQASIQKLLKLGAKPDQLVLGLPLYGRNFNLEDEKNDIGFGAPAKGQGFTGPYVNETGTWGYNEICDELGKKHSNWVLHWDDVTRTPYMTYKEKFMSYDNERSLTEKVQFALSKKLAGVVVYSLDTDDFRGACAYDNTGVTNYPLMTAINKAFYTASYGPMEPCENAPTIKTITTEVK